MAGSYLACATATLHSLDASVLALAWAWQRTGMIAARLRKVLR